MRPLRRAAPAATRWCLDEQGDQAAAQEEPRDLGLGHGRDHRTDGEDRPEEPVAPSGMRVSFQALRAITAITAAPMP